jgi:hypothetical protein
VKIHIFHNWLYKYQRYPMRVHAFSTGPGPDWIDRHCYDCGKTQANPGYQAWLDLVKVVGEQMDYERKKYGHVLIRNIAP